VGLGTDRATYSMGPSVLQETLDIPSR